MLTLSSMVETIPNIKRNNAPRISLICLYLIAKISVKGIEQVCIINKIRINFSPLKELITNIIT